MTGIYAIRHTSGSAYVGSSVDIERRWKSHIRNLTLGVHSSSKLQTLWNEYGTAEFSFVVLEVCDRSCLISLEQSWIDRQIGLLNEARVAGSPGSDPVIAEKISAGKKRGWANLPKEEQQARRLALVSGPLSLGRLPSSRDKVAEKLRGRPHPWHAGQPRSDETKIKISKAMRGQQHTLGMKFPDAGEKHRIRMMGNTNTLGMKCSAETKRKHSEAMLRYWQKRRDQKQEVAS